MGGEWLRYRVKEKEAQPEPPTAHGTRGGWHEGRAACHEISVGKFLAVVVGVVVVGLTLRFTLNRSEKPKAPPKPSVVKIQPPGQPEPAVETPTPVEVAVPAPEPTPEPPRIAGTTQISSTGVHHFATGPGVIYYCDQHDLMRQPKTGGDAERIGDCSISSDLVADANGVFYSSEDNVMRVTAGTTGSRVVAEMEAIVMAIDAKYVYFARPGFEGVPDPGVYRVERAGGTPERVHQRAKEQFGIAVDDDAVWISGYFTGTVTKVAKAGTAKPRVVLTAQKNLDHFVVDATHLYWSPEGTNEIRRRKKAGGTIEVIGRNSIDGQVQVVDGHAYWFERSGDSDRLLHLAPGASEPVELAKGLRGPRLRVDAEGVYVNELDRDGIFMFKR